MSTVSGFYVSTPVSFTSEKSVNNLKNQVKESIKLLVDNTTNFMNKTIVLESTEINVSSFLLNWPSTPDENGILIPRASEEDFDSIFEENFNQDSIV